MFLFSMSLSQVMNQSSELADYNLFLSNDVLVKATRTFSAEWAHPHLTQVGIIAGCKDAITASVEVSGSRG